MTVVEGDQKAPFSIATTPRCKGGRNSFPWIAPLYPWYIPYIAECKARRYLVPFLKSLIWLDLGLNPGLPDHWRTLYPLDNEPVNAMEICLRPPVSWSPTNNNRQADKERKPWNRRSQTNFHGIRYINLIYIYYLLL